MEHSLIDVFEKGLSPRDYWSFELMLDCFKGGYSSYKAFAEAFLKVAKEKNPKFVKRYSYLCENAIRYFSEDELKAFDIVFNMPCEEIQPRECTDDCSKCHLVSCGIVNGFSNERYLFEPRFIEYDVKFHNLLKAEFEKIGSPFEERIEGFYKFVR